jgi:two-component system phosphate regulon sensor histidine kinase PhoR
MANGNFTLGPELLVFEHAAQAAGTSVVGKFEGQRYHGMQDLLLHENRKWFISLRWLVIVALAMTSCLQPFVLNHPIISTSRLLAATGILFLANCLFLAHHRQVSGESQRSVLLSIWFQVLVDMLIITFLLNSMDAFVFFAFTPMLFIPHIILSSIMLRPICSVALVVLSNLLYGGCLYNKTVVPLNESGLGVNLSVQLAGTTALSFAIWYLTCRLAGVMTARDIRLSESHKEVQASYETSRSQMYHTAHQMKSPVVAIQSLLELYRFENEEALPLEVADILNRIEVRCDHLLEAVSEMLFLAKVKAGETVNWNVETVNLDCLVRSIIGAWMEKLEARSIRVIVSIDPYSFVGDRDALEKMVGNLVANAVNYSLPGGKIHITGRATDLRYRLDVEDSGIGIKADQLEQIFEPHYRTISAKRHQNVSTGLGLPIVRAAARLFGLSLSVRSKVGKGSCFTLSFPAAADSGSAL